MSQCATSRPRLQIKPSCLVFQRTNRLQEHKGLQRCHRSLAAFRPCRAPVLSPSSRLSGTAGSGSCTQSTEIKVYLCQGANIPNGLKQVGGGGVSKVVGGQLQKKYSEDFSSLRLLSPSSFLAKDKKHQSCQMTAREKRRE